jgi:hypothetical protein
VQGGIFFEKERNKPRRNFLESRGKQAAETGKKGGEKGKKRKPGGIQRQPLERKKKQEETEREQNSGGRISSVEKRETET